MPDERKNDAILEVLQPLINYNRIDGYVEKINFKTKSQDLSLDIISKDVKKIIPMIMFWWLAELSVLTD